MGGKKKAAKKQARDTMELDDGWNPDRPNNVYPTQRTAADGYDGRIGRREPHIKVFDKEGRVVDWAYIHEMEKINPSEELMRP